MSVAEDADATGPESAAVARCAPTKTRDRLRAEAIAIVTGLSLWQASHRPITREEDTGRDQ
jgi:hypothetical protein